MRVRLLRIDDCPGSAETETRLRSALDEIGLAEVPIVVQLIATAEDADGTAFAGSPTIEVDGRDLFPEGEATHDLACRVYRTPSGLAGAPTREQLVGALTATAGRA
jgi:hypothetical protein